MACCSCARRFDASAATVVVVTAAAGGAARTASVEAGAAGAASVAITIAVVPKNGSITLASACHDRRVDPVQLGLPGARHLIGGQRFGIVGMERTIGLLIGLLR